MRWRKYWYQSQLKDKLTIS